MVGDPSEQDGSASLHARLGLATHNADTPGLASGTNSSSNSNNRPGRTALCRDLMDVVAGRPPPPLPLPPPPLLTHLPPFPHLPPPLPSTPIYPYHRLH